MNLSKSQYLTGLQCHKALWLNKNKPELAVDNTSSVLQIGDKVGELARGLFVGGVLVAFEPDNFAKMLAKTKTLLQTETVIYEASFRANNLFVMVDILVKNIDENNKSVWDIYEVKSATKVKQTYLNDVSVQHLAIDVPIGKSYLILIDNSYIREGELALDKLFKITDISQQLTPQKTVLDNLATMHNTLTKSEPNIDIGTHCSKPYDCNFIGHCWGSIPKNSVFNLYRLGANKKFEYYQQNKISYADLQNKPLTPTQKMQISGKEFIDKAIIEDFMQSVNYPINFFDFETLQNAVPRFDGQKPYAQIPFQYSLHILHKDGRLQHQEFLADCDTDPRQNLAQKMLDDIDKNGSIMAFNQSFEIGRIKDLAKFIPQYQTDLLALIPRFVDLLSPFRKLGYYHPDFNGSFSIKSILPAMFPDDNELDYKKLGCVQNGGDAMSIFANLYLETDQEKIKQVRQDLLRYCHLDTLAMVRIWQALQNKLDR